MIETITSKRGAKPIGPYSQAVRAGDFIFPAGQAPFDPETGEVVKGGIREQAARTLENLKVLLEDAGGSLNDVAKVTVYLQDLSEWAAMNEVYVKYFKSHRPARTVIKSDLMHEMRLEMDVIAYLPRRNR